MGKGEYWQKGYEQGLDDGKAISNQDDLERIVKEIFNKYSYEDAQEYTEGWQEGFSESVMDSINKLRKKIETDIA